MLTIHCSAHLIFLNLTTQVIFVKSSNNYGAPHYVIVSTFLDPNMVLSTLFSTFPYPFSSFRLKTNSVMRAYESNFLIGLVFKEVKYNTMIHGLNMQ
jgi:hypothetical protein